MKALDRDTYRFDGSPERITLHWTGGSYTPSSLDAEHYHFLIDGDGCVWLGKYSVLDQDSTASSYAAHCAGFNTKNIGVAFCAMAGAQENGSFGKYPINQLQWQVAIELCAWLLRGYGLNPTESCLASHCEIERIHGRKQSGKWDVSAVKFRSETWSELNDVFRNLVREYKEEATEFEDMPEITVTVPIGTIVNVVEI